MRKRAEREAPGTRIVTWFAVTSLLVFALIGAGITVFRTRDVRAREERAAAARAELVAREAIAPLLTPSDLAGPITGTRFDTLERQVAGVTTAVPSIVRVKIWSTDGTVLFSNDPAQIGTRPGIEGELRDALDGELATDISDLTKNENASERRLADKLFETYIPFRFDANQPIAGVIEVYQDYSVIQAEIDRLTRTLSLSLGAGLLVLYAVVLPLMVGLTRTLRRQNQQLHEQADQLGDLLEHEQETVAELRALDRLKGDFVAAASHELRTPLTNIVGYAHLLRGTGAAGDPEVEEAIGAIERQSGRLQRMISNLLRESHLEHGDTENAIFTFAFDDLVREVVADFHGADARVVEELPSDLPLVACDRRRLEDVLTNLVDNALKYSLPETRVTIGGQVADDTLTFWVRDEGIGIAPEDLPRIFERFYQADQSATRSYGGVGLGLHIVRGLVETMGGAIDVRSEPGAGSTFTVSIPLASAPEPTAASPVEIARR
jgi:signal transduction histidine kinase